MNQQPLLCVDDLSVHFKTKYGSAAAVNHISFSMEKGEKLGLVGESGSGKSVTSKSIIRLLASAGLYHRQYPPQRRGAVNHVRAADVPHSGQ